jgi:bifunctional ADP-heptose synthase (sugar kinase/adenylyltransferase)
LYDIIVAGDLLADETQHVTVTGVTPESANVLSVTEGKLDITPGGAGNVALNCAGLGCKTIMLGSIGWDDAGRRVTRALTEGGVDFRVSYGEADTRARRRIVSNCGMILRLNRNNYCSVSSLLRTFEFMEEDWSHQVLVLSDYGGHFLTGPSHEATDNVRDVVSAACARHIPILVDPPRDGNWKPFGSGQTIFKPNLRQALTFMQQNGLPFDDPGFKHGWDVDDPSAVPDLESVKAFMTRLAQAAQKEGVHYSALWVTMGAGGSAIYSTKDVIRWFKPTVPVEVRDVTGAGDTAIAVMAAVMAHGEPVNNGAKLANIAGGIAVQKRGCWKANWDEIFVALKKLYPSDAAVLDRNSLFRTAHRCASLEKP